jgi:hypothetical protein
LVTPRGLLPSRRYYRPQVEALESRDVPSLARWTSDVPHTGDRVDTLIQQLLPATRSGVEFFQNLTAWIATSFAPNARGPGDANYWLGQLAGDCTVRSLVWQSIAERMGIAVQTVGFAQVPYQGGHTADEVRLGGHWYFFDATTGSYLAGPRHTTPLELLAARSLAHTRVMESTAPLWRGHWSTQRHFTFVAATQNLVTWQHRPAFLLHYTYIVAPAQILGPSVPVGQ